jgi:hypothetical protein
MTAGKPAMITMSRFCFLSDSVPTVLLSVAAVIQLYYSWTNVVRTIFPRRDDYSTSPKRKEECLAKSPRLSNEHDKDKKRRSCSRDDGNNCCDADIGLKE